MAMPEGKLEWKGRELWVVWMRPANPNRPAKERRARVGRGSFSDPNLARDVYDHFPPDKFLDRAVTFAFERDAVERLELVPTVKDAGDAVEDLYANRTQRTIVERQAQGFINPYGFVPAPPRRVEHKLLGDRGSGTRPDHAPASHARYGDDLLSGVLRVRMTVKTPLLLRRHVESVPVDRGEHKIYEIRCTASGEPDVHPSGVKGMLSAAFEAATNSRMRIFDHNQPLTRRMQQSEAASADLVAVRVIAAGDGLRITRMEHVGLPAYDQARKIPEHGTRVAFESIQGDVVRIAIAVTRIYTDPAGANEGWVVVTRKPATNTSKTHEAIFAPVNAPPWNLDAKRAEQIRAKWRSTIDAYVAAAKEPGGIRTANNAPHTDESYGDLRAQLRNGGCLLCWAKLRSRRDRETEVDHLVPTRFGRATYATSPRDALPDSIRPAQTIDELSPADRVFGWVGPEGTSAAGDTAHRGQLRIDAVRLKSSAESAIRMLDGGGLPLQALSSPKPAQALFYAAADMLGTPMPDGDVEVAWDTAYRDGASIAGRKVYCARTRAWTKADAREPGGNATTQNGTIRSWIEPGTEFEFDIRVTNLNSAEAGALMWLLSRESDHRLRLGGGRPLGFGEIHLTCTEARLRTGAEMRDALRDGRPASPSEAAPLDADAREDLIQTFLTAVHELSYDATLAEDEPPDHLAALLASMTGLGDAPVHYPRMRNGGDIFEWFSRNVQRRAHRDPAGIALPGLTEGLTLPDDPTLPG